MKISKKNLFGVLGLAITGLLSLLVYTMFQLNVKNANRTLLFEQTQDGESVFVTLNQVSNVPFVFLAILLIVMFIFFALLTFKNPTQSMGLDVLVTVLSGVALIITSLLMSFNGQKIDIDNPDNDYMKYANISLAKEVGSSGMNYDAENNILTLEYSENGGELLELDTVVIESHSKDVYRIYYTIAAKTQ